MLTPYIVSVFVRASEEGQHEFSQLEEGQHEVSHFTNPMTMMMYFYCVDDGRSSERLIN